MSHISFIAKQHALSENDIATFAKPPTRWDKLAIDSNEQVFKSYRKIGNIFSLIAATSATGFIISLSYRKTDLLKISGLLTVGSFFAGLAYKFSDKTAHILQQREEVRKSIGTSNLARIRLTYPDNNIISNQELNEWARYFLHTQPFNKFLADHWHSIFNFKLEDATTQLIRDKYFYQIYHPDDPNNLMCYSEVLNSKLFNEKERKSIEEFQANVRTLSLSSLEELWKKYESVPFSEIPENQRAICAWSFTINIWNEKIGIKALNEEKYKNKLEEFALYFTNYCPKRYIADREAATLGYVEFITKNGIGAMDDISNILSLLNLILPLNEGLERTLRKFKVIASFGDSVLIEQAVLRQEWSQLENLTYMQVRERNGHKAILKAFDPEVRKQLKEKYLRLSPSDLAPPAEPADNAEQADKDRYKDKYNEYKSEIEFLEITETEVFEKLSQTKMTFKEILALEPSIRDRLLELSKKNGKTKAKEELKNKSVADVLNNFKLLFEKGVLDFTDYAFTNRLKNLGIPDFIELLKAHGAFILENKLLKKTDHILIKGVSSMIFDQRQDFLTEVNLLEDVVWKTLAKFTLIQEDLLVLRKETLQQWRQEDKKKDENLKNLEVNYAKNLKEIDITVQAKQKGLEDNIQECKSELSEIEDKLLKKQGEQKVHLEFFKKWEVEVETNKQALEVDKARLEDKKRGKAELKEIPEELERIDLERKKKLESLLDLEIQLKEESKSNLEKSIKVLEEEISAYNEKKIELGDEQDKVLSELKSLEEFPVSGLDSQFASFSCDISEDLSQTSKNSADVSSNANLEAEGLKTRLGLIEETIDDINIKIRTRKVQIREKKQAIETASVDFSQCADHEKFDKESKELAKGYRALQEKQSNLIQACYGLDELQKKVDLAEKEIDLFPDIRRGKEAKTRKFERKIKGLQAQKESAERDLQGAELELNSVKAQLSKKLIKEAENEKKKEGDKEKIRHSEAKDKIMENAKARLTDMLRY